MTSEKRACCFCALPLELARTTTLVVYPPTELDEAQTLFCHGKCLVDRLDRTVPLGQQQLDDILNNPNTVTRGINGGNFSGGRYYIAPDGRGAAFDANGTFQYFGVFTP